MDKIEKDIYNIAGRIFSVSKKNILPDERWENLDLDSLSLVEFIVSVKDRFKIDFKPEELRSVKTLNQFISFVMNKMRRTKDI